MLVLIQNKILKIKKILIFIFIIIFSINLFFPKINTLAEVYLKGENEENYFFFKTNPGKTINSNFVIYNPTDEDINLIIKANDTIPTSDWQLTLKDNQQEQNSVGKWIFVSQELISLKLKSNEKIPFIIKIPENIQDGEYIGGISVTKQYKNKNGISTQLRKTLRIYISINKNNFENPKADIKDLQIWSTKNNDHLEKQQKYSKYGRDNLTFSFLAKNLTDYYLNLTTKYIVNLENGDKKEGIINSVLIPFYEYQNIRVFTGIGYVSGKNNVEIENIITPYNPDIKKDEINLGKINAEINLSQEDLDGFLPSKTNILKQNLLNNSNDKNKTVLILKNPNLINILLNPLIIIIIIILILIEIIIFLILKNKIDIKKIFKKQKHHKKL